MALINFTAGRVLGPDATHAMTLAFDRAWQSLQETGHISSAPFRADKTREILAKRIVEMAQRGEEDADRLRQDALAFLAETCRGKRA